MTFVPHISVTTTPGYENGASVKVAFIKKVLVPRLGSEEINEEREGPELAELDTDTAHGVAKLLHETIELRDEIEKEDSENKGSSIDSFLDGDPRMGGEDHESDAAALADAQNFNVQQSAVISWYERLVAHLSNKDYAICPHCRADLSRSGHGGSIVSSDCVVCGGVGYLERRADGSLVKSDPDKEEPIDNPPGFKKPLMPESEWFEPVVKGSGGAYVETEDKGDKKTGIQLLYEKMTERARDTIVLATKEAKRHQQRYVGTAQLLAALARGGNSVAATALHNLHIDLEKLILAVDAISGTGDATEDPTAYTPHAKEALFLAEKQMSMMGHRYIGTEHILVAIMKIEDGMADRVVASVGSTREAIIKEVYGLLGYDPSENPGCQAAD